MKDTHWGFASSSKLYDGKIILQCDVAAERSPCRAGREGRYRYPGGIAAATYAIFEHAAGRGHEVLVSSRSSCSG